MVKPNEYIPQRGDAVWINFNPQAGHEQAGQVRAEYGRAVLRGLSDRLTREFGRGYSIQALRNMRQFYRTFLKRSALRSESLQTTQLFISKYMLHLPTEEELRLELERECKMVEEI